MNPTAQDRTFSLWRRFGGLFGGDAVERKFGPNPPVEWVEMVGRMNDFELQRGLRRLVASGKAHVPTLPEFVKLCRAVGDDAEFGGSKATNALPAPPPAITDVWGSAANTHLLGYVLGHAKDFRGPDCGRRTEILVRWKNEWARLMRDSDESEREVPAQKSLWAACMNQAETEIAQEAAA
jgi:hypothetical protein